MSLQFTSEHDYAGASLADDDEDPAIRSHARLLISAATQREVETLAYRVRTRPDRVRPSPSCTCRPAICLSTQQC